MKKFFLFSMIILLILPLVIAPPKPSITNTVGYQLSPSQFYATKFNQSREFYIHITNTTTGLSLSPNGISCYLHIYKEYAGGNHIYINYTPAIEHEYDFMFYIPASNFSEKGEYSLKAFCNATGIGGLYETSYYVTGDGHDPASDFVMVMIYILFIISVILFLYFTIMNIAKLVMINFTLFDVVYSWLAYILLIIVNYLGFNLLIRTMVEDVTSTLMNAGVLTLGVLPPIFFIISTIIQMTQKKKPLSVQEITGGRLFYG